LPRSR